MIDKDTIIALATAPGAGAIAVLRISGPDAIALADTSFRAVSGTTLARAASHTLHLGDLLQGDRVLDQVLVSVFRAPRSYTGEEVVEISCHGSPYIQQEILQHFLTRGCRMAKAGEFTLRAFLNGKMDLSQAEAVADLIASENEASHQIALQQMRGGYSSEIHELRQQLLNFASLIALELDFSGEDVEFANRGQFEELLNRLSQLLKKLLDSFALGNVIKKGIPVAIAGQPNVGKSTLLNALLREEKAVVSDVAGTTRDAIEDEIVLQGIGFRFIDTAGIRDTQDTVESIGIQRTFEKIEQARVILFMLDGTLLQGGALVVARAALDNLQSKHPQKQVVALVNKADQLSPTQQETIRKALPEALFISAKTREGLDRLEQTLLRFVNRGLLESRDPIVSNARHFQALQAALESVEKVREGMEEGIPTDLVAIDINQALYHLGEITGEISTDDLLGNIFSNFCIGK